MDITSESLVETYSSMRLFFLYLFYAYDLLGPLEKSSG